MFRKIAKQRNLLITVLAVGVIGTILLVQSFADTASTTYSGKLNNKSPSASYNMSISTSGTTTATYTYSRLTNAKVSLVSPTGAILATGSGASPITVSAPVSSGTYKALVSGTGSGSYTLQLSYPVPSDTTPPTVSITTPTGNATVSGTTNITGTASDNQSLSKVDISIDGGAYQLATGTTSWSYAWNTTSVANGSHTITARATDANGNMSTSIISVTVSNTSSDKTPPVAPILTSATPVSSSQINLSWSPSTDNVTPQSNIAYQVLRNGSTYAATGQGATTFSDSGLLASTSYTYQVKAFDQAGNFSSASNALTAQTLSVSDTKPPSVSITNPLAGSTLTNTVAITGTASDDHAVWNVAVSIDDGAFYNASGMTSWSYNWDTTKVVNGSHTIVVRATDSSNNQSTTSVTVSVNNVVVTPPSVAITNPSNNSTVRGLVDINGTASADTTKLVLYVSGNGIPPFSLAYRGTTAWKSVLNTISLPAGSYMLTAVATASSTSISSTSSVTIVIPETYSEPAVTVNTPASGATVSGNINVSGTVASPVGAQSVSVFINDVSYSEKKYVGSSLNLGGSNSYSTTLDTTVIPNGNYNLIVMAHDNFGYNQAKFIPITINNTTGTGAPVMTVTSPAAGQTVSGTVNITGTTTGENITWLEYTASYMSGWKTVKGLNNWVASIDTTKLSNGPQKIYIYANSIINSQQYQTNTVVTLNVNNPSPTAQIVAPPGGSTVSGIATVAGTATDGTGTGLHHVMVAIDGVPNTPSIAKGTSNWSIGFNSYGISNGLHTVTATAYSNNGTPSVAATAQINIQNTTPPTPASSCPNSSLPLYDSYTSPDGRITADVCTLVGAWTAEEAYNVFQSVTNHDGIKGGSADPQAYGHIHFSLNPDGTPGNGGLATGYGGTNAGTNGANYSDLSGNFSSGTGLSSTGVASLMSHEYLHMWSTGGAIYNPANWTGSRGVAQPYGYPSEDNLTRVAGANGDPTMRADYLQNDGNDVFAESAGFELNCRVYLCYPNDVGKPSYNITGLPSLQYTPGWLEYITNRYWW